jgi:CHAD domain-containing protein
VTNGKILAFNESFDSANFASHLIKPYSYIWTETEKSQSTLLDTFDGRMFCAGYSMHLASQTIYINYLKNGSPFNHAAWSKNTLPISADDFTDAQIKAMLTAVLGVRKLLPCLQVKTEAKFFNLLNEDQKIIGHGKFISIYAANKEKNLPKVFCTIKPLRGYSADLNTILKDFPAFEIYESFNEALLNQFDTDFKDNTKPGFTFTASMPVSHALNSILRQSFDVMRKNEQGIIDDIDIEFLHDFRVSGRRMRSALSLIKGVLAEDKKNQLTSQLKQIGNVSGPLRDLDVYLLREEEYISLLPQAWAGEEIHHIFKTLKMRRGKAYTNMCVLLQSVQYQKIVAHWEDFLQNFKQYVINDPLVFEEARLLIIKHYKNVIKKGKKLSDQSPDEGFHDLRISCKKLRYLMEFFSSLFNPTDMIRAIKQLKNLQDNLGNFNDLSVQIETLNSFMQNKRRKNSIEFIQAVSGLIAVLNY